MVSGRDRKLVFDSECRALIGPCIWNAFQQLLHGQGTRLATFNDGLDDVRGKIAEPQKASDMSVIEVELSCDFHRVRIFPTAKIPHPGLGSRNCENKRVVDPER